MKVRLLLLHLLLLISFASAQSVQQAGIINHYAAASGIDTCTGGLVVSDTTGFREGMEILMIQMQGADISTVNSPLFGILTALGSAGRWERNYVDSIATGVIFLKQKLLHSYKWAGKVQIVTIPVFSNLTVTDTLKPRAWNGTVGGVLALKVTGILTLNAPVWADATGFRGGAAFIAATNNCNGVIPESSYVYAAGTWRSSLKGEGIAAIGAGREMGRGPQANGGGGGNDHNSGGGGGGNFATGGRGGNNDEPLLLGCDGYYPGLGGYGINSMPDRFFLGGGGGAGHTNNILLQSTGGNGGGLIWIEADQIVGTNPVISANGAAAATVFGDGGGGGGAGGTIWLRTTNASPVLVVRANGGKGGNTNPSASNRCQGPGGGGAGGRILTNLTNTFTPMGGAPGVITNSTANCNGSNSGAVAGGIGNQVSLLAGPTENTENWLPKIVQPVQNDTICPGESAQFNVTTNVGTWNYQWQEQLGNNWQNLTNTTTITGVKTPVLQIKSATNASGARYFRCQVIKNGCGQRLSNTAVLSIVPGAVAAFSVPDTIVGCSEAIVRFNNQSLRSQRYEWIFPGGTPVSSKEASPQMVLTNSGTYTATLLAFGSCQNNPDTLRRTFFARLLPAVTADFNFTALSNLQVKFTPLLQNATSVSWLFGDNTPVANQFNPIHTYAQPGKYIVSLMASNGCGVRMIQKKVVP